MTTDEVVVKGRDDVAQGTMAFRLSKPADFRFKPGQAVDLALIDPPTEANSAHRIFSLVSAPFEEELAIATRMRASSAFKRALKALPLNAGITPFLSMLRQAAHDRLDQRLLLLYSNRRPEDAAFLAELQGLARRNDNFRLLATMTDIDGWLNEGTVKRFVGDAVAPVYYLAGPPAMVAALTGVLSHVSVRDEDVRSEEFYGY